VFNEVDREEYLMKCIKQMQKEKELRRNLNVLYLFYDGFTQVEYELREINPYD
jgi:hypothetical protein